MLLQPQGYKLDFPLPDEIDFSRASGRLGPVTRQHQLDEHSSSRNAATSLCARSLRSIISQLHQRLTRLIVVLLLIGFLMMGDIANAGSFMEFLKAIGNSIAHPQKKSQSHTKGTKEPASRHTASPNPTFGQSPAPPVEPNVRTASAAPEAKDGKADVPYAIPVPGKRGFVISPFAPDAGYVDVHQFPPGTEVKDPFTGKVFLTP
jgi:hypothetical protein